MKLQEAAVTVEVVAALLCIMAEAEPNASGLPAILLWLGQRLETASVALSGGGQA